MKAKKILLLAAAAFAIFTVSSCKKEYYVTEDGLQMSHIDFTVKSTDWTEVEEADGSSWLSVQLDVPQITKNVVDYGMVTMSRRLFDENNKTVWIPLPVVTAEATGYGTEEQYLYSTYLDFEWSVGYVMVYYTGTDLMLDDVNPDMDLRVTIYQY